MKDIRKDLVEKYTLLSDTANKEEKKIFFIN